MSEIQTTMLMLSVMGVMFLVLWIPNCAIPWIRDRMYERRAKRNLANAILLDQHIKQHARMIEVDGWFAEGAAIKARLKSVEQHQSAVHEDWVKHPSTATCHICGKRDFKDNLADVGWMETPKIGGRTCASEAMYLSSLFAHPECAKIKRSDDGKGWVRVKK